MTPDRDTDMGGRVDRFPATRHSAIVAAASDDADLRSRAMDALIAAYWKPVYKYVRIRWKGTNEDAKDLTQGFFAGALEKEIVRRYDPARGSFRNYLRLCVDGYVSNERKAAGRGKRGGGTLTVPLDFEGADGELREIAVPGGRTPEEIFDEEWARSLFELAIGDLRERLVSSGRAGHFELFHRYDVEGAGTPSRPTYDDLARSAGLTTTQVTNHLAAARRELREILLDRLREITGSEEEFRAEARALLGHDPR